MVAERIVKMERQEFQDAESRMAELQEAKEAAARFQGQDLSVTLIPYGSGHIHKTYLVEGTGIAKGRWILQKINTAVFLEPERLMENTIRITEHFKSFLRQTGGVAERETLTVVSGKDGAPFVFHKGGYYRMFEFIEGSISYDLPPSVDTLYESGRLLGRFMHATRDFKAPFYEVLPGFHDTPERFRQLLRAEQADLVNRRKEAEEELEFALEHKQLADTFVQGIQDKSLPIRITHNDPKLNNFLFDRESGRGLCLIDLDTVMPGLAAWDFGDALRTGAAAAPEDEKDLTKVKFRLDYYEEFLRGYLGETKNILTVAELRSLPLSAAVMTFENGMRFLTDYLSGDIYYHISYPEQNKDRCRAQFALVRDIEAQLPRMKEILFQLVEPLQLKQHLL